MFAGHVSFERIDRPHAAFHQACGEAIGRFNSGDLKGAEEVYQRVDDLSSEVLPALDELKQSVRR